MFPDFACENVFGCWFINGTRNATGGKKVGAPIFFPVKQKSVFQTWLTHEVGRKELDNMKCSEN